MENKISVVFCSRKNGEENKGFIEHINNTCGCDAHVFFIHNPDGVSISKIYADMIDSKDVNSNIIVFVHDDIEFLRSGWGKEILRLFNEHEDYGIIGVAGSAQFDSNGAWWQYEKKYGQVLHRNNGKSWLTAFSPLIKNDLEEVCVIDGLFMAIHKKRISKNFDADISGFNFYDIDFCLANYIDGKTKIGVTTNIRLAHNSVGELKDEWYANRDIIIKKYKDKLPIKMKK